MIALIKCDLGFAERLGLLFKLPVLGHVGDMGACVRPGFSTDQEALLRAQHAMAIGAQLEALATWTLAAGVIVDAVDMAQA